MLVDGACAVLYRTDTNLGRLDSECETDDKEGYTYTLKCVTPDDAPFVYRLINNETVQDEDKVFNYNGKLAKFIEEPHLEIVH